MASPVPPGRGACQPAPCFQPIAPSHRGSLKQSWASPGFRGGGGGDEHLPLHCAHTKMNKTMKRKNERNKRHGGRGAVGRSTPPLSSHVPGPASHPVFQVVLVWQGRVPKPCQSVVPARPSTDPAAPPRPAVNRTPPEPVACIGHAGRSEPGVAFATTFVTKFDVQGFLANLVFLSCFSIIFHCIFAIHRHNRSQGPPHFSYSLKKLTLFSLPWRQGLCCNCL